MPSPRPLHSSRLRPRVAAAAAAARAADHTHEASPATGDPIVLRPYIATSAAIRSVTQAGAGGHLRTGKSLRQRKIPLSLLRALATYAHARGREVDAVLIDALQSWLWDQAVAQNESSMPGSSDQSARRSARRSAWHELDEVLLSLRRAASYTEVAPQCRRKCIQQPALRLTASLLLGTKSYVSKVWWTCLLPGRSGAFLWLHILTTIHECQRLACAHAGAQGAHVCASVSWVTPLKRPSFMNSPKWLPIRS